MAANVALARRDRCLLHGYVFRGAYGKNPDADFSHRLLLHFTPLILATPLPDPQDGSLYRLRHPGLAGFSSLAQNAARPKALDVGLEWPGPECGFRCREPGRVSPDLCAFPHRQLAGRPAG